MAGIHFALSFGALLITSYATVPPPQHAVDTMVWTPAVFAEETESLRELPWYKNYRYQGIALCVVVAIILIVY